MIDRLVAARVVGAYRATRDINHGGVGGEFREGVAAPWSSGNLELRVREGLSDADYLDAWYLSLVTRGELDERTADLTLHATEGPSTVTLNLTGVGIFSAGFAARTPDGFVRYQLYSEQARLTSI